MTIVDTFLIKYSEDSFSYDLFLMLFIQILFFFDKIGRIGVGLKSDRHTKIKMP